MSIEYKTVRHEVTGLGGDAVSVKPKDEVKKPTMEDIEWLYKTFDIITPYMIGRINVKYDTEDESDMSIPAQSFAKCIYNGMYGAGSDNLSDDTCRKIILNKEYYDDDDNPLTEEKLSMMSRDELDEYMSRIESSELDSSNYKPSDTPVFHLFHGMFVAENWEGLSDSDLWKWCAGWGAIVEGKPDPKRVRTMQNCLLREIESNGHDLNIRGVNQVTGLIDKTADPDYKEETKFYGIPIIAPSFVPVSFGAGVTGTSTAGGFGGPPAPSGFGSPASSQTQASSLQNEHQFTGASYTSTSGIMGGNMSF